MSPAASAGATGSALTDGPVVDRLLELREQVGHLGAAVAGLLDLHAQQHPVLHGFGIGVPALGLQQLLVAALDRLERGHVALGDGVVQALGAGAERAHRAAGLARGLDVAGHVLGLAVGQIVDVQAAAFDHMAHLLEQRLGLRVGALDDEAGGLDLLPLALAALASVDGVGVGLGFLLGQAARVREQQLGGDRCRAGHADAAAFVLAFVAGATAHARVEVKGDVELLGLEVRHLQLLVPDLAAETAGALALVALAVVGLAPDRGVGLRAVLAVAADRGVDDLDVDLDGRHGRRLGHRRVGGRCRVGLAGGGGGRRLAVGRGRHFVGGLFRGQDRGLFALLLDVGAHRLDLVDRGLQQLGLEGRAAAHGGDLLGGGIGLAQGGGRGGAGSAVLQLGGLLGGSLHGGDELGVQGLVTRGRLLGALGGRWGRGNAAGPGRGRLEAQG